MRTFRFQSRLWIPRPRNEVFEFFSSALNLETITPAWLQFRVVSAPPIHMFRGAEIEYRLKIHRFPVTWQSRITVWDPPQRFVDEQVRGPYRRWIHEHRFLEESYGTSCQDEVEYAPLGGALINTLFVERDIRGIFAYRSDRLQKIFPANRREPSMTE
jgi:ligand-binding SRPBCC domain-containing protein